MHLTKECLPNLQRLRPAGKSINNKVLADSLTRSCKFSKGNLPEHAGKLFCEWIKVLWLAVFTHMILKVNFYLYQLILPNHVTCRLNRGRIYWRLDRFFFLRKVFTKSFLIAILKFCSCWFRQYLLVSNVFAHCFFHRECSFCPDYK